MYKNAFATNHSITDDTAADIVLADRTSWKVENENNHTLNTKGDNLEHNFGHENSIFPRSWQPSFLLSHILLELFDQKYKLLRSPLPTSQDLF